MSGNNLVDDFLTEAPVSQPPRHASPMAGPAGVSSSNPMITIFTLQQRLLTVMNEAVGLIGQLQQLGVFPSDAESSPEENAAEATQLLLASLLEQRRMQSGDAAMAPPSMGFAPPGGMNTNAMALAPGQQSTVGAPRGAPVQAAPERGANNTASGGFNKGVNSLFAAPSEQVSQAPASGGQAEPARAVKEGNKGKYASAGGARQTPRMLAFVEFKRNKVRKYACDVADIHPGTYVLVDGDRGTDCALLVQTITYDDNGEALFVCMDDCHIEEDKIKLENGRVLRAASNEDIDRLHNVIYNAEAVALKTCRERCKELGIDIKVLDAEYQFDMKKISFYFDSVHSVDFRVLVRELYRTFGARIWMENVNPSVKNSIPDAHAHARGSGGGRQRK